MEKRIELELRGRPAAEVTELNLDNCKAVDGVVAGLTKEFSNLQALSLINVGLSSLKGFPALPALNRLELSDNRLAGSLENLGGCKNITHLNLSGNKIASPDELAPLKSLKSLRSLDLFNCDITNSEDYRENVFSTLPDLKFLDGFDREDREAEESDDEDVGEDDEDEINDLDDDDEDDDEDEEEDEEAGGAKAGGEEVGLSYLESSKVMDEDETEDFVPNDHGDDEDEGDEDDGGKRGTKRKHGGADEDDEDDGEDE